MAFWSISGTSWFVYSRRMSSHCHCSRNQLDFDIAYPTVLRLLRASLDHCGESILACHSLCSDSTCLPYDYICYQVEPLRSNLRWCQIKSSSLIKTRVLQHSHSYMFEFSAHCFTYRGVSAVFIHSSIPYFSPLVSTAQEIKTSNNITVITDKGIYWDSSTSQCTYFYAASSHRGVLYILVFLSRS